MTHYKIVKKTYYGIDKTGEISEESKFRPYKRYLWLFWTQLQTYSIFSDGSTVCAGSNIAFDILEDAEIFIHKYHANKHKVGTYTLETIEKINLK